MYSLADDDYSPKMNSIQAYKTIKTKVIHHWFEVRIKEEQYELHENNRETKSCLKQVTALLFSGHHYHYITINLF
jgi:uncharacterized protein YacL (UPF0231 family)